MTRLQNSERKTAGAQILDFAMQTGVHRCLQARRFSYMTQEAKQTYTIRLPEQVAARIEAQATGFGIAPTTLIQSLISVDSRTARPGEGGLEAPAWQA